MELGLDDGREPGTVFDGPRRLGRIAAHPGSRQLIVRCAADEVVAPVLIDRREIHGSVDLVGAEGRRFDADEGARVLALRTTRKDLAPNAALPSDTRLWAALQLASGENEYSGPGLRPG